MYLSRLELNPRSRKVCRDLADCQRLHVSLMQAFPTGLGNHARAQVGLLYRTENTRGQLIVIAQAIMQADWARLGSDYLLHCEQKKLDELLANLRPGLVLRFRLRANPTRKVDTKSLSDGLRRNGRRVELLSEEEQMRWLERKAVDGGFALLSTSISAAVPDILSTAQPKQHGYRDDPHRGEGRRLSFASVVFDGLLRVNSVEPFLQILRSGVGSAKAYGFGLLSIAPGSIL